MDGGEDEADPTPPPEELPSSTLGTSSDEDEVQSPPGTYPLTPCPIRQKRMIIPETPIPKFITAEGAATTDPADPFVPFDGTARSDDEGPQESDGEALGDWIISYERRGGTMIKVDDVELNSFVISGIEDSMKTEETYDSNLSSEPVASSTPVQSLFYDEHSSVIVTRALQKAAVLNPGEDFFLDPADFVSEDEDCSELVEAEMDGPADGLMRSLSTMKTRGTFKKLKDQVTMAVKDELVLIYFPEKLKSEIYGNYSFTFSILILTETVSDRDLPETSTDYGRRRKYCSCVYPGRPPKVRLWRIYRFPRFRERRCKMEL